MIAMKRGARTQYSVVTPERRHRRGSRCAWVLTAYGMWWVPSLGRWSKFAAKGGPRGTTSWCTRSLNTRTAALRAAVGVAALGCGGRLQRAVYDHGTVTYVEYAIPARAS
jgi:hypothetical protein